MHAALPFPCVSLPFFSRPAELRVDVGPSDDRGAPLASLYERMRRRADPLHGLPTFRLRDPRFKVHVRSVSGEWHAYVEDTQRRCLAGCTVFNRLAEVDRRADRHLRSPHSRYLADYQRQGIATAIYEWALAKNICLMTGARQSTGAHALWRSLARRHEAGFVEVRDKRISYLGADVTPEALARLDTRMFLLPADWPLSRFLEAVGIRAAAA